MEARARNNFCFFTRLRSIRPALPLVRICPTRSANSTSFDLLPGNLKPMVTFSASGPTTSARIGAEIDVSGRKLYFGTGFGFMYEKAASIFLISISGLKSPLITTAILLGT